MRLPSAPDFSAVAPRRALLLASVCLWACLTVPPALTQATASTPDTSAFAGIRAQLEVGAGGEALAGIRELVPRLAEAGDPAMEVEALLLLGVALQANALHEDALGTYERARAIAEGAADRARQGQAYRGLGASFQALDRFEEAAVHFGAAVPFSEDDPPAQIALLRAQSRAYLLAGRGQEARIAAVESAEAAEAAGLVAEQAESLRLAAATSASIGQHDLAYRTLRRAEGLQEAEFAEQLAAQRTDLERSLLAALATREAERLRGDERTQDLLEAEQLRWRRRVAMVTGALTLGAIGMALVLWSLTAWRRYRIRTAVRRRRRKRRRRLRRPAGVSAVPESVSVPESVAMPEAVAMPESVPGTAAKPDVAADTAAPPGQDAFPDMALPDAVLPDIESEADHDGTRGASPGSMSGDALPDNVRADQADAGGPIGLPFVR
ncbi:MAG: hypothetical protein AAFV01_12615, partial [Bacteroidota bacterium]